MKQRVRLSAPAKINWTLEVLSRRPDGYHELRSVLQTIDLCDTIVLSRARSIDLVITGDAGPLVDEPMEENLAWRAAWALQRRYEVDAGVRIELEKRVPVAAGLGGGSSDAAAVLRGCRALWGLDVHDEALIEVAAEIGSDPPFFVIAGTAATSGRGEVVVPLPDAAAPTLLLATPPRAERREKTAEMFRALTPRDYTEGDASRAVADTVEARRAIAEEQMTNVFERVAGTVQPETERARDALRQSGLVPHLAGAGPAFFLLLDDASDAEMLLERISGLGFEARIVRALAREAALRIEAY